jgi:hypothetical protein
MFIEIDAGLEEIIGRGGETRRYPDRRTEEATPYASRFQGSCDRE